ncbi:glycosyltransferase [uncultured Dysosmobacter sp.]|uniref:glycosyltransferase n=1 Tax=uncultured Dysosmobacter sp. TaxID=2591384 RepID=UPI00345D1E5D
MLFLGFRTDIPEIMSCLDAFAMPLFREGVPRALLETMDFSLPCVGSRTRGITNLLEENVGGFLCDSRSPSDFAKVIAILLGDPKKRIESGSITVESLPIILLRELEKSSIRYMKKL